MPLSLFAAQYSEFTCPECHHHPSMMHLSTQQGISLGQKIVHGHRFRKTFDGAGCLYSFKYAIAKQGCTYLFFNILFNTAKIPSRAGFS